MAPKLSIIMSTYNDGKYLEQALQSILNQTFSDWELIIVNDASTDTTEKIIKKFFKNDSRLDYLKNPEKLGITTNIKMCIKRARAPFIARLDSDDHWLSENKLAEQYQFMQDHPKVGLLGTWAKVVDLKNKELYRIEYATSDKDIREKILRENSFVTSSIMFRKPTNNEVNQIRPSNHYADDYNLNLQLGISGEFANIPKLYTAYRSNPAGVSQTKQKTQIIDTLSIVTHYRKFYSGFYQAYILWTIRMIYPSWLRGKNSMKLKKFFKFY